MDTQFEARNSERFSHLALIMIEEELCGGVSYGILYNESRTGMYVVLLSRFQPGTYINIRIDNPRLESSQDSRRAQVIWCKEMNDDPFFGYGIGVKFC
jgi:hypothetical protein